MQKVINSTDFRKMVSTGARMLEINRAKVDALNVFPVPDGDTGTNMSLTMQSAITEMNACSSNRFEEICDAVSKGALRGARGNSGVITSQIFRGICSVVRECKQGFDTKTFAKAMEAGTKVAYNAVSKPKEGTILTVVRMMSEAAPKLAAKNKDFVEFFTALIAVGDEALAKTPELLPVLKKAGVVDDKARLPCRRIRRRHRHGGHPHRRAGAEEGARIRRQFRYNKPRPRRNRICLLHRIFHNTFKADDHPCGYR